MIVFGGCRATLIDLSRIVDGNPLTGAHVTHILNLGLSSDPLKLVILSSNFECQSGTKCKFSSISQFPTYAVLVNYSST